VKNGVACLLTLKFNFIRNQAHKDHKYPEKMHL